MVIAINEKDCTKLSNDITDKLVVVKMDFFDRTYQEARYQLVKATGGFGCNAGNGKDKKVFVKDVFPENRNDGIKRESYGLRRSDLLGEPTAECLSEYQELYGEIVLE